MYKSIFFIDLDGTVIQEVEPGIFHVPTQFKPELKKLEEINCLPVVCTARQPGFVKKLFGDLFSAGIFFNGSYILYKGTVLSQISYTEKQLSTLFRYSHDVQCGLVLQGILHAWCYNISPQYFPLLNQMYNLNNYIQDVMLNTKDPIYSIDLFFTNTKQGELAQQNLSFPYTLDYHEGDWTGVLTNLAINKGTAALTLCQYLGIQPMNCYGIGDSKNDIPLFQTIGHGIAVKNACAELLAVAKSFTDSCMENGIIAAIHKIIISNDIK